MSSSPRPAKRLRRSTTILSDDDYQDPPRTSQSPRQVSKGNATQASPSKGRSSLTQSNKLAWPADKSSANSSPKSSPEKARKKGRLKSEDIKNRSLHNFFGRATEDERWHKKSQTPEVEPRSPFLEDDIVDDEPLDEITTHGLSATNTNGGFNGTQSPADAMAASSTTARNPFTSSQRFIKPIIAKRTSLPQEPSYDSGEGAELHRTWADKYGPSNVEELAVHKKKVADVGKWLEDALSGRSRQRLLVLKGPAGTGKTATVELLTQARKLDVVMWQNPTVSESGTLSASLQFGEFLSRGGHYGALSFADENRAPTISKSGERVLLVEDFPSTMTRSSSALDSFRSALQHYLVGGTSTTLMSSKSALVTHPPLIIIVSETLVSSATAVFDSFTAHRLLGPELSNHPSVTVIEFNPVAPTFITKALDVVVKKEARDSKRRRIPGPAVMQKLAEVGDIRSAINSLEFLCARGEEDADWSGTVAANPKRNAKSTMKLTEMEENTLRLVSQRETTLDMFHAAGKVVYNKREDPSLSVPPTIPHPKPPEHLMHIYTPKVSQVDIEALLNETGTDIQTFISTLHENYVLSCNGDEFVDHLAGCSHFLSDSDVLNPDSRQLVRSRGNARSYQSNLQFGTSDSLRQDEISFQIATRGLLFSLPSPVHRATPPGARKSDSFKMFYPASLRIWKPTEEINDLIQFCADQISNASQGFGPTPSHSDGVASWKNRIGAFASRAVMSVENEDTDLPPRTDASKETLVLETFPFMAMIKASHDEDVSVLKKITTLRGINVSGDEPYDEELEDTTDPTARLTQRVEAAHTSLAQQARKTMAMRKFGKDAMKPKKETSDQIDPSFESLVIEDDDIEDD